jgi:hypothetical protein
LVKIPLHLTNISTLIQNKELNLINFNCAIASIKKLKINGKDLMKLKAINMLDLAHSVQCTFWQFDTTIEINKVYQISFVTTKKFN